MMHYNKLLLNSYNCIAIWKLYWWLSFNQVHAAAGCIPKIAFVPKIIYLCFACCFLFASQLTTVGHI